MILPENLLEEIYTIDLPIKETKPPVSVKCEPKIVQLWNFIAGF
jgi:hypothetical protein